LSHVQDLYVARSRSDFGANDVTLWLVDVLRAFYGVPLTQVKTEVVIKGESRGRADLVVQDSFGIETKRNLGKELGDALVQVKRILTKLEAEGDRAPIGIATDGESWRFYVLAGPELFEFHTFQISPASSDESLKENLWKGLTTIRFEKNRPPPTAEAVSEAFRPGGPAFNEARSQLVAEAHYLTRVRPVDFASKFEPWFEVFGYVYNNFEGRCDSWAPFAKDLSDIASRLKGSGHFGKVTQQTIAGGLELFIRHTYLAVLAKILAAIAALGEDGVARENLRDASSVLSGEAVRSCGIWITEANDFFVWPASGLSPEKLVATLTRPLRRFSAEYTDDVFRHLYESVVDAETRHELGEFFTPKWIAQQIVADTVTDSEQRVLDPSCGSGTFLVMALRRKAELSPGSTHNLSAGEAAPLLESVWGFDVNPLSVILARTNLYLALCTLLPGRQLPSEIHPRVYVSDTLVLPRFEDAEQKRLEDSGSSASLVSTPITPQITIPILPRLSPEESIKCVEVAAVAFDAGARRIGGKPGDKADLLEYENALLLAMSDLKKRYGNSLWKFVLRNYGLPPLLRRSFDSVVGNPPWLSFREARKRIQDSIEALADQYGVSPAAQVKTSFNLGVAFFLASTHFLRPGGRIGFVLPLSVLDSPAHARFLEMLCAGERLQGLKFYDLAEVEPHPFPHNLETAVVIARAVP
jgi:hypothetical protein